MDPDEASSSSSPPQPESQHLEGWVETCTTVQISDSLFKLYEPNPSHRSIMDLFFFHGLQFDHNSDAHISTWRSEDATQEVWPQRWLPRKYPRARIISVSYDAAIRTTGTEGMMDLHLIGENLLQEILWTRQGNEYPVILVGHSFGGLVIKQLCVHAYRRKEKSTNGHDISRFLETIRGILFYGTPHRGINGILGNDSVMSIREANGPLISFVKRFSPDASRLHVEFEERWRDYKWQIYGIGETQVTPGHHTPLVPEASSRFGDHYITVASDHFSVCRPKSKTCNKYLHLAALINTIYLENQNEATNPQRVGKEAVGVESLMGDVQEHLRKHAFVGLSGMGGIGKTTVAKLLYDRVVPTFEYTCFVDDFKLIQGSKEEIKEKIWRNIRCHGQSMPVSRGIYSDMWREIRGKKLLIVFDDIAEYKHVELVEEIAKDNASEESRFITTSQNEELLNCLGGMHICQVPLLEPEVARELFISHAFPGQREPPEHLKDNVEEVVKGCDGLPLTLEVLGRYLGRVKVEKIWTEIPVALRNAEAISCLETKVWGKLQLSYDALGDVEKNMFLDVASFLLLEDCPFSFDDLVSAWSSMYGSARTRWQTLLDRSLVQEVKEEDTIGKMWWEVKRLVIDSAELPSPRGYGSVNAFLHFRDHGKSIRRVHMHEHLRRMGQRIAREFGRSRDMNGLLGGVNTRGDPMRLETLTGDGDCCNVDPCKNIPEIRCSDGILCSQCKVQKIFPQLTAIRCLKLDALRSASCQKCKIPGGFSLRSGHNQSGLVMLDWCGSYTNLQLPLEASLCRGLVVLKLTSCTNQNWGPDHDILAPQTYGHLSKLERLELGGLLCVPHTFGELQQLRHLKIRSKSLQQLPESVGSLSLLEHLELQCESLCSLPSAFGKLSRLQSLQIGCTQLQMLPDTFGDLSRLKHLSLGMMVSPRTIDLFYCNLQELPETFGNLRSLESLYISDCAKLHRFPETFGNLGRMKVLNISNCSGFEGLPETFGKLSSLESLHIRHCAKLRRFPETFGNVGRLKVLKISSCSCFQGLPETFGNLSSLESLYISFCANLHRFPETFGNLGRLKVLNISNCSSFEGLPETFRNLSSLEHLEISMCDQFQILEDSTGIMSPDYPYLQIAQEDLLERFTFAKLGKEKHLRRSPSRVTFANLDNLKHFRIYHCAGVNVLYSSILHQ